MYWNSFFKIFLSVCCCVQLKQTENDILMVGVKMKNPPSNSNDANTDFFGIRITRDTWRKEQTVHRFTEYFSYLTYFACVEECYVARHKVYEKQQLY